MKRIAAFLLVLVMLFTALASCSGETTSDTKLIELRIDSFAYALNTSDTDAFLNCFDAKTRNQMKASLAIVGGALGGIDLCALFTLSFAALGDGDIAVSVTDVQIDGETAVATVDVSVGQYGPYPTYFYMVKQKGDWFIKELEDVPTDDGGNDGGGNDGGVSNPPNVYSVDPFENRYAKILYSHNGKTYKAMIDTSGNIVHQSENGFDFATYGAGVWCLIPNPDAQTKTYEIRKADGSLILSSQSGAFDMPVCGGDGYVVLYKKETTMTSVTHKLGVIDKNGTWLRELTDVSDIIDTLEGEFEVVYRGAGFFSFIGPSSREIYFNVQSGAMMYLEDVNYLSDRFVDGVIYAEGGIKVSSPSEFYDTPDGCELPSRYALCSDGTVHELPQWDLYGENFAKVFGSVFVIENDDYFMIFNGKTKEQSFFEYEDINADLIANVEFHGEVGTVTIHGLDDVYYYALIDTEGTIIKEIAPIPSGADYITYFDGYLIYSDNDGNIYFTAANDPTKTVSHERCSSFHGFGEDKISIICLSSTYTYIKSDGTLLEIKFN